MYFRTDKLSFFSESKRILPCKTLIVMYLFRFNSSYGDAEINVDFDHQLNQEIIFKPGEVYAGIPVNIVNDSLPENNEVFHLTLTTSDDVTTITTGFSTVVIQDNGMCRNN